MGAGRGGWVGAAALALVAFAVALWREAPAAPELPVAVPPSVAAPSPASLSADATARGVRLPEELTRRYPPKSTVRFATSLDPRDFTSGVACPGGGFLPLLNGVPFAQPLHRNIELFGPVPPVIGKYVDEEGSDWYVHADGSETTTRWATLRVEGVERRDVRTDHTVPARGEHGLPPPTRTTDR